MTTLYSPLIYSENRGIVGLHYKTIVCNVCVCVSNLSLWFRLACFIPQIYLSRKIRKRTFEHASQAKIQISLRVRAVWPQDYKTFFMLNSAEHEFCPAYKSQITNNCKFFLAKHSWAWTFLLINMKMPTIVGIFIFISREIFMLSWVE